MLKDRILCMNVSEGLHSQKGQEDDKNSHTFSEGATTTSSRRVSSHPHKLHENRRVVFRGSFAAENLAFDRSRH